MVGTLHTPDSNGGAANDDVDMEPQYLPVPATEQEKVGQEAAHTATGSDTGSYQPAYKLRRFPLRALALIIIPPIILTYFVVIKSILFSTEPEIVPYGHRNARWVYYSWFFIGVFGLSVSRYGLEGAEAAMLQDPFWAAKDGLVLFSHAEKTWTGLSGWWTIFKGMAKNRWKKKAVGRLWALLTGLTLLAYVALPLSGLTMELYDGYVKSSEHPRVLGRTLNNFNDRYQHDGPRRGGDSWAGGAPMTLPGASILYTSPDINRGEIAALQSLPNSLPQTDGLMDIFLAPQAITPVEGRAWGLRLGYKCDIITSASNFTLLNQRWSPGEVSDVDDDKFFVSGLFNRTTITFWRSGTDNVFVYGETAEDLGELGGPLNALVWRNASTFDEEGLESAGSVIEIVLWQLRHPGSYGEHAFNETVQPSIADLGGPFISGIGSRFNVSLNSSFFPEHLRNNFNLSDIADPWDLGTGDTFLAVAEPIGVRCVHQYDRGFAYLHPESATFTSFTATKVPHTPTNEEDAFGKITIEIMRRAFGNLYAPTAILSISNSNYYTRFIDSQTLQRAIMRAYAMDALQLMYDGGGDFADAYEHENLTATKKGKILGPGDVPAEVPLVLFALWAAGCMFIGVVYGFKPRWAETLNGFGMFCLGGDFAKEVRGSGVVIHKDYTDSEGLGRIPGMIGDASSMSDVGRLALVDRRKDNVVDRDKLYQ